MILEADASNFALGGVASQVGEDGLLHPVTFHSRKFNPAEVNYEIYDRKMLAIVECMEKWRYYFEGLGHKTIIYSDHKNLLWFTETKIYNRRQARWAEKLSRFDFVIVFRPGKEGGKPDALFRRPDYGISQEEINSQAFAFLKPSQVNSKSFDSMTLGALQMQLNQVAIQTISIDEDLLQDIKLSLPTDAQVGDYLPYLHDPALPRPEDVQEYLAPFRLQDGLLLRHDLIYVPDQDRIKLKILQSLHDSRTAGHLGQAKTLELVSRDYYWPRLRQFVNEYINSCDICSRTKVPKHRPHASLHSLPIPSSSWSSVSMDYIVELPESGGYNAIYVCVDRFTKMAHFCPTTTKVTAEETAKLYLHHVFKHHDF